MLPPQSESKIGHCSSNTPSVTPTVTLRVGTAAWPKFVYSSHASHLTRPFSLIYSASPVHHNVFFTCHCLSGKETAPLFQSSGTSCHVCSICVCRCHHDTSSLWTRISLIHSSLCQPSDWVPVSPRLSGLKCQSVSGISIILESIAISLGLHLKGYNPLYGA